jgi:glycosyltransferase involved in cell wall biosynthesis
VNRAQIAIDGQLMFGTPTGIGEFLHELLPALRALDVRFDVLSDESYDPWRFDRRFIWDQYFLPRAAEEYPLLHCCAGTMPFMRRKSKTLVTVHDVAWLRVQQHTKPYARAYFGAFMMHEYRRAQAILTVSEFSRSELLALGHFDPKKIHVILPGVSTDFMRISRRIERPRGSPALILAVGTVERRKNLTLAIRALARMNDHSARLISCGPPTPYLGECRELAQRLGIDDRVEFRGYVERRELLDLYTRATIAAVPSRYEGFGLAVAQALVTGIPLVVAATSSLPEIAGTDAYLLDPDDEHAWAQKFDEIIADEAAENTRAEKARAQSRTRFSWMNHAEATNRLYRDLIGS